MESLHDLLFPFQKQFIDSGKKRKLWLSARQIGKSFALAYSATAKALSKKNGLSLCISTGGRAASELVKKVQQFAEAVKVMTKGKIDYVPSADQCRFSNGSRVVSLPSGNATGLRGWSAQCVIIDECAFIERPYEVMAAIAPTLTRDPDAELIVASTPAGRQGLFWDLYSKADDSWYIQKTTIEDAKAQGLDVDIGNLRSLCGDPDVFDQEYMCVFAKEYSSFIDLDLLEWYDECPREAKVSYMGMDVGSASDRTAIATTRTLGDTLYVDDITMMHKASYESQLNAVRELYAKNGWRSGYIDQNGIGSALAEFVSKQVSSRLKGFTWTASNKTPAYEALRAGIFDHKIKFARHLKNLVEEDFQNVRRIVSESGKTVFEAGRDRNGHSDATSALVLAVQASKQNPVNLSVPVPWSFRSRF